MQNNYLAMDTELSFFKLFMTRNKLHDPDTSFYILDKIHVPKNISLVFLYSRTGNDNNYNHFSGRLIYCL